MRDKIYRFMMGRNGADDLSRASCVLACILVIINIFTKWAVLWGIGVALLIYSYVRMLSKNVDRRRSENEWFLQKKYAVTSFFTNQKNMASQRKDFRFYKCPSCKTTLRVPRGKGKIRITCRKCGTAFERKT